MSLPALIRSGAPLRQQVLARARSLHTTSPVRGDHGHYHHLPFQWPGEKKLAFGLKLIVFLSIPFSIPFIAAKYQLNKSKSG